MSINPRSDNGGLCLRKNLDVTDGVSSFFFGALGVIIFLK